MKEFVNKTTGIKEENKFILYSDLCKICINKTPEGGFTIEEMSKRLRIMEVLNKKKDKIILEDFDFEILKACIKNIKWGFMHKDLVEFNNTVVNL